MSNIITDFGGNVEDSSFNQLISMVRKELTIGSVTVLAFMDAQGLYYLNSSQVGLLLELSHNALRNFILKTSLGKTSPYLTYGEMKMRYSKGSSLTDPWNPTTLAISENQRYRVIPVKHVVDFIRFWDKNGNQKASDLTDSLMHESLQIRCESVFVGVSPNVKEILEQTNHWLAGRGANKSVHAAFHSHCMSESLPVNHVHDRITKLVFGQTANQARSQNILVGEDPTIGLDYQADVEGQLLIARVKLKYMGLKKGTWQERVDRAYEQSV
jgi:hypothetical protein